MRKCDQETLDQAIKTMPMHRVADGAVELLRMHDRRLEYVSPEQIKRRMLYVILQGIDAVFPPEPVETA